MFGTFNSTNKVSLPMLSVKNVYCGYSSASMFDYPSSYRKHIEASCLKPFGINIGWRVKFLNKRNSDVAWSFMHSCSCGKQYQKSDLLSFLIINSLLTLYTMNVSPMNELYIYVMLIRRGRVCTHRQFLGMVSHHF